MASLIPGEGANRPQPPIYLVAEAGTDSVRVQVVGKSEAPYEATFSLEVEAGGNVSRHRGSAALGGGAPVTLSTVTVGIATGGQWRARLTVEPATGNAYEQVQASD